MGPWKKPISLGITAICITKNNHIFIGGGDGSIKWLNIPESSKMHKYDQKITEVTGIRIDEDNGMVTSMVEETEVNNVVSLIVGTSKSEIYRFTCNLKNRR